MSGFQRATKTKSKLRLAIIAVSGAGKTYTALTLAKGLGERVALVDSEHGSASKYADRFDFDTLQLDSFHPQRYIDAIRGAEQAGYDVLVIDSLSHAWTGKDGALALVDIAAKRNHGNSYVGWRDVTPLHNQLIDAIVGAKLHVIATMRAKTEYVLEPDPNGKQVPRKIGMAPVQRDGMEYEFDVVADMDTDHNFLVTKSRVPGLDGAAITKPDGRVAQQLREWLEDGAAPALAVAASLPFPTADEVRDVLSSFTAAQSVLLKDALTEAGVEFGATKGELVFAVCNYVSTDDWHAAVERIRAEPSFPGDLPDVQRKQSREKPSAIERRDKDDAKADAEAAEDPLFNAAFDEVQRAKEGEPAYSAEAAS